MKYIFFLITVATLATSSSFAQSKGAIHLSLGGALPVGGFGSKSVTDEKSGGANLGSLAEIGYEHALKNPHWGLTLNIRGRLNAIDRSAAIAPFQKSYPQYTWSATKSHYKTIAAMAGVYYNMPFPANSKWDFRLELDLGVAKCYTPDFTVLGTRDTANIGVPTGFIEAHVDKASAIAFSAAGKASIIYHLGRRWQLLGNIGGWYAQPNMTVTKFFAYVPQLAVPGVISVSNSVGPVEAFYSKKSYKLPMATFDFTAGIAFDL